MKPYTARYTLRDGRRGVLAFIADSSCAAIVAAIDHFGTELRCCSVRPRHTPPPARPIARR